MGSIFIIFSLFSLTSRVYGDKYRLPSFAFSLLKAVPPHLTFKVEWGGMFNPIDS